MSLELRVKNVAMEMHKEQIILNLKFEIVNLHLRF